MVVSYNYKIPLNINFTIECQIFFIIHNPSLVVLNNNIQNYSSVVNCNLSLIFTFIFFSIFGHNLRRRS